LFILFTVVFFSANAGGLDYAKGLFYKIFGVLYIVSLIVGMVLTTRMRRTVETL